MSHIFYYAELGGKKLAYVHIWSSSNKGKGYYNSYIFELIDDKWFLTDKFKFSDLKFISILIFIFLSVGYILMGKFSLLSFIAFILAFLLLNLLYIIYTSFDHMIAKRFFKKMLKDEKRYMHTYAK